MNSVNTFTMTLFERLRSRCPIDTANMLSHITYEITNDHKSVITIAAPYNARDGLISKRTGKPVTSSGKAGDYSRAVNYSAKSPHQFWVEQQIKYSAHIVKSNADFSIY